MNPQLKTIGIAALVALVVSGGIWLALPAKGTKVAFGNTSIDGSASILPTASNFDYLVARVALGLGTNLSNINITAQKQNLTAATTTPCNIQNPFNATSTLVDATMNITTSTSTAMQFVFATSTSSNASTSLLSVFSVAANTEGTYLTGPTASSTGLGVVLGPKDWVVVGVALASGSGGLVNVGGTCSAVFQSM